MATISPVPRHKWQPQASGIRLNQAAARKIEGFIEAGTDQFLAADRGDHDDFNVSNIKDGRERINRSTTLRRGQQVFRAKLLAAYQGKCAVTSCEIEDLLEAAHIEPYQGTQTNHVQNGLLLRSDIHTLFDCGLLAIDPSSMKLVISPQLVQSSYRKLAGRKIRLPKEADQAPSKEALAAHRLSTGLYSERWQK